MESLFIPTEQDFQRWINNAVRETLGEVLREPGENNSANEPLLSRKEIIILLQISTATLTNWQRKGLPFHKKGNRVYFLRSEVVSHIISNKIGPCNDGRLFSEKGKGLFE